MKSWELFQPIVAMSLHSCCKNTHQWQFHVWTSLLTIYAVGANLDFKQRVHKHLPTQTVSLVIFTFISWDIHSSRFANLWISNGYCSCYTLHMNNNGTDNNFISLAQAGIFFYVNPSKKALLFGFVVHNGHLPCFYRNWSYFMTDIVW